MVLRHGCVSKRGDRRYPFTKSARPSSWYTPQTSGRTQRPELPPLCVDNKAAVSALAKGSSSPDLVGALANLFGDVASRGNTRRWTEYVDAKSNSGDPPSRHRSSPNEARCTTPQGRAPTEFRAAFSPRGALLREPTLFTIKTEQWAKNKD